MATTCFHLDPYFALDVGKKASNEEITKAYLRILKDRHPDGTKEDRIYYGHIKEAFQLLMDKTRRKTYDKCRQRELAGINKQKEVADKEAKINFSKAYNQSVTQIANPVAIALLVVFVTAVSFYIYRKWKGQGNGSNLLASTNSTENQETQEQNDNDQRPRQLSRYEFLAIARVINRRIEMDVASGLTPASDEDIFQLVETFKYEKKNNEEELCTICQDVIVDNQNTCHLPGCKHTFHFDCLYPWLKTKSFCPNCKEPLKKRQTEKEQPVTSLLNPSEFDTENEYDEDHDENIASPELAELLPAEEQRGPATLDEVRRFVRRYRQRSDFVQGAADYCAVCHYQIKKGEKVGRMPCGHKFHFNNCLLPVLQEKATCPLCQWVLPQMSDVATWLGNVASGRV